MVTNCRSLLSVVRVALIVCLCGPAAFAQDATVTRNVNLRSEPTSASSSVRLLNPPEKLTLVEAEASSGYYHVKTEDGAEGWVWGRNIHVASVIAPTPSPAPATPPEGGPGKAGPAEIYPDSVRTPGAPNLDITQANIAGNICNKDWSTTSVRPPTSVTGPIKTDTMTEYGFTDPTHYELDHLESLQVGGCPDCKTNLWPEAYGDVAHPMTQSQRAKWNHDNPGSSEVLPGALEKDKVENHVHDEICFSIPNAKMSSMSKKFPPTVSVTLERGQQILAKDWYGCYFNMLHGNKPCE